MTATWKQLLCKDRPRESTNPKDHRTEFERDYDRTIFSTPVKRLQDKAQVFPLEPNDAVRTRLTHSLEVSSVSRGLGISVGQWLLKEDHVSSGMERLIEAICSTCGLIHDLGNPPFGHSGEDAIRDWFKTRFGDDKLTKFLADRNELAQDFLLFDGNAQSLRLLTKLQILADFNGLNLTFGTLSASCKYTASSNEVNKEGIDHAKSKLGFFTSETNIVQNIRERSGTGNARNPLTYLIEAADDIVYSVADIEDAVKKGIVRWSDIDDCLVSKHDANIKSAIEGMVTILKAGKDKVDDNLPGYTYASAFRTAAIQVMVSSVIKVFISRYDEIMAGDYRNELIKDCDASALVEELKSIGQKKVYCTSSNLKLELMGHHVICDLMDIFWEGARNLPLDRLPKTSSFEGKVGALFSDNYRQVFLNSVQTLPELPQNYHRLQLMTDYICGMTDTFAKRLHTELTNG
ncbi:dGTP triphosphohydrolase [Dehalogenimonas etheniformans]|uniref:HD domain-containing protein n=1 Tax=Dehalogenimonas etheniformans TaxID=1536648 RepID=A0A2P5P7Z0_9CHLR|nr:dNTP triphosphohydrolase [Dehalogenimonas etheniformans]PPD58399.1 HD domain-containing protein [Dehalogenimonas etheniformans]QNT76973.1 dNTP triphosphohydrolase [Dehalogenimonas etheniformans]